MKTAISWHNMLVGWLVFGLGGVPIFLADVCFVIPTWRPLALFAAAATAVCTSVWLWPYSRLGAVVSFFSWYVAIKLSMNAMSSELGELTVEPTKQLLGLFLSGLIWVLIERFLRRTPRCQYG